MRLELVKGLAVGTVAAGMLLSSGFGIGRTFGDEPKGIGRLFRMGGSSSSSTTTPAPPPNSALSPSQAVSNPYGKPALSTPPVGPSGSTGPRITPKPRINKPVTEADPLVTRISLGRSDNGGQFGMFLQVYADGTVIDGEGVHKVGPDALKPVVEAVSSGDLAKLKGHCGGPAGDFIENVQVVVYERSYGRLRATAYSHSGNTQGCDHAVHHLQTVLDALQAKISPAAPGTSASLTPTPAAAIGPALR